MTSVQFEDQFSQAASNIKFINQNTESRRDELSPDPKREELSPDPSMNNDDVDR